MAGATLATTLTALATLSVSVSVSSSLSARARASICACRAAYSSSPLLINSVVSAKNLSDSSWVGRAAACTAAWRAAERAGPVREATGARAVEARPRVEVALPRVEAARPRAEAACPRAEADPLVLPDDRAVFVGGVTVAAASSSLSSASSCTRAFLPPAPFLEALPRFRPPLALGGGGGGGGTAAQGPDWSIAVVGVT